MLSRWSLFWTILFAVNEITAKESNRNFPKKESFVKFNKQIRLVSIEWTTSKASHMECCARYSISSLTTIINIIGRREHESDHRFWVLPPSFNRRWRWQLRESIHLPRRCAHSSVSLHSPADRLCTYYYYYHYYMIIFKLKFDEKRTEWGDLKECVAKTGYCISIILFEERCCQKILQGGPFTPWQLNYS